jgi:hypothetical protein
MSITRQVELSIDSTGEDQLASLSWLSLDRSTSADLSRSEINKCVWRSYLPEKCVETMVKMGWDEST